MNGTLCCCFLFNRNYVQLDVISERLKNASFDVANSRMQSNILNGLSCTFICRFRFKNHHISYVKINHWTHTRIHIGLLFWLAIAPPRAHTIVLCNIFFLVFTHCHNPSNRFNVSIICVCVCIPVIQTIFVCLFANFKLASVQYNINISVAFEYNYQNHNKNHDLSIFLCGFFSIPTHIFNRFYG